MSEPDAAFLKLRIERADLVRWLDAKPPQPALWTDWRSVGGQWYFDDGVQDIGKISDAEMQAQIADCAGRLTPYATNRQALRDQLNFAEAAYLRRVAYDSATRDFVAGTLTYSENLIDFLVFLTVARGAAAFLGPEGYGIAVIHNYVFGVDSEHITQAALRLGPGDLSGFMGKDEGQSAAGAFQALADGMMQDQKSQPTPIDELDTLI